MITIEGLKDTHTLCSLLDINTNYLVDSFYKKVKEEVEYEYLTHVSKEGLELICSPSHLLPGEHNNLIVE